MIVAIDICFVLFGARQYGVTTRDQADQLSSLVYPSCDLDNWCRNISDLSLSTAKDSTCCAEFKKNKDLDILKVTEIKRCPDKTLVRNFRSL